MSLADIRYLSVPTKNTLEVFRDKGFDLHLSSGDDGNVLIGFDYDDGEVVVGPEKGRISSYDLKNARDAGIHWHEGKIRFVLPGGMRCVVYSNTQGLISSSRRNGFRPVSISLSELRAPKDQA